MDQLSVDLFAEKRRKNICTPSATRRDTLMYRLGGGSAGSFSSRCARSLSACAVQLQHALNCLSQTRCSKAFPSLPKFNSGWFTLGEMRARPPCCYARAPGLRLRKPFFALTVTRPSPLKQQMTVKVPVMWGCWQMKIHLQQTLAAEHESRSGSPRSQIFGKFE